MAADNHVTPLPTPPNRGMDSTTFTTTADAFLSELPDFGIEINAVTDEVNANADAAAADADTAVIQAMIATTASQVATSAANANTWVSGTNYTVNTVTISPIDFQSYRAKVSGVSTIDPVNDSTNWVPVSRLQRRSTSITSSATPTPNSSNIEQFNVTALAATAAFGNPTGSPLDGQTLIIRIKDNGTARALSFGTAYRASPDLALPFTTTANKTLYLGFIYNAADSKWDLTALLNNI